MEITKNKGIIIVENDPFYKSLLLSILYSLNIYDVHLFDNFIDIDNEENIINQCSMIIATVNNDSCKKVFKTINSISESIKVVFISNSDDLDVAIYAFEIGAYDYIIKNDDVKNKIASLLYKLNYY